MAKKNKENIEEKLILKVIGCKKGQKRVTIPKKSKIKKDDYVRVIPVK